MASRYQQQAATALRMIKAKGATATFTRKDAIPGTFDPVTQITEGAKDLVLTMPAIGFAPGKSAEYKIGTLTGRKLEELHCAPNLGACPAEGDIAKWKGADWKVIWIDELNPDGEGAPYCKVYLER